VSQTLIRDVIYAGSQDVEEVVFRTLPFKIFNKIETWEYLVQVLGERPRGPATSSRLTDAHRRDATRRAGPLGGLHNPYLSNIPEQINFTSWSDIGFWI
jgi:alpha-glutamyl/putrescinyl thymine pyrophosphorylase clade 1